MEIAIYTCGIVGFGAILIGLIAMGTGLLYESGYFARRLGLFSAVVGISLWLGLVAVIVARNELNTTHLIRGELSEIEAENEVPEEIST